MQPPCHGEMAQKAEPWKNSSDRGHLACLCGYLFLLRQGSSYGSVACLSAGPGQRSLDANTQRGERIPHRSARRKRSTRLYLPEIEQAKRMEETQWQRNC